MLKRPDHYSCLVDIFPSTVFSQKHIIYSSKDLILLNENVSTSSFCWIQGEQSWFHLSHDQTPVKLLTTSLFHEKFPCYCWCCCGWFCTLYLLIQPVIEEYIWTQVTAPLLSGQHSDLGQHLEATLLLSTWITAFLMLQDATMQAFQM